MAASRRWIPAAWILTFVMLSSGCASGGSGFRLLPRPVDPGTEPWQLVAGSFPSQRLYRVKYAGPEGKASFKLTLYLASASQYRMVASDGLGRKLWSLQVDASGRAVWLDHRNKQYCEAEGADRLIVVPLANLPLASLPRLLLGRLPVDPAAGLERGEKHVSYLDGRGLKWTGVLADGAVEWWTLEDLGETVAWWRRDGDTGDFSDARGSQRLTWRETVAEVVEQSLEPLEIPARFEPGACAESRD